jgi:hypothetical protein
MTREKPAEPKQKRLKERDERLKRQKRNIKAHKEKARTTGQRKWTELAAQRRKIDEQIEKAGLKKERREKTGLAAWRTDEEEKRRRKEEAKYFYCVIPFSKEKSFGNIGVNDSEVYTIPYRDIAAVVSDSPMKDYEMTEDNTRRHETVLRQVMKEHTVAPVEFGTTTKNERILKHLLRKAYNPTKECLKLVYNMVELGIKAILNEDTVFFDHKKRKECISDILGSLDPRAKQAVTGDLFSDRLILNASYLVNKEDINAFSNEVTSLQEKYPMLRLLYSGPWAPYNFVYIKIGAEGMEFSKKG